MAAGALPMPHNPDMSLNHGETQKPIQRRIELPSRPGALATQNAEFANRVGTDNKSILRSVLPLLIQVGVWWGAPTLLHALFPGSGSVFSAAIGTVAGKLNTVFPGLSGTGGLAMSSLGAIVNGAFGRPNGLVEAVKGSGGSIGKGLNLFM